jgi:hypothetical protein
LHQLKTNHKQVLNISKKLVEGVDSKPPVKLTKLSIPDGEEEEKEKWETIYSFRCLECNVEISNYENSQEVI